MLKVGGADESYLRYATPMSTVYTNEITESGQHVTTSPTDSKDELANKIGLMYASDYGYATPSSEWSLELDSYSSIVANDWIYRGVSELMITRYANYSNRSYILHNAGTVGSGMAYTAFGV